MAVTFCKAQDDKPAIKRFSFGFNLGSGYPLRDYGSIGTSKLPISSFTRQDTNALSGYAKQGIHYGGFIAFEFTRRIGITLSIEGDENDFDLNAFNSQYFNYFPPGTASAFTAEPYYITEFFLGPHVNFPISQYCSIQCSAMAGIISVTNPSLEYNGRDTVIAEYSQGTGYGYRIGANIKYEVTPDNNLVFGFHLDLGYTSADITYSSYSLTYSTPFNSFNYNIPKTMALGILQVSVGAHLAF